MVETAMFNMGDILATIVILGFFLFLVILVVALVKKNKSQPMHEMDLKKRIDELEMRVETLEKEPGK
ncbi:MAG: hypothetical protein ACQEV0_02150 [Bacillota bacterium]